MRLDEADFFGQDLPSIRHYGIKADSMVDGNAASAILPFSEALSAPLGMMDSVAIAALLDASMAASVRAHAPLSFTVQTLDLSVKFIRMAGTDLYADCRCEHRGHDFCIASGTVFDDAGAIVATANGIFKLLSI